MTVFMVRVIGLVGAALFLGVLLVGVCVVAGALKDLALAPRRRERLPAHAGDVPCGTISGSRGGRG